MPGTTVVQKLNSCCPQSGGNMIAEKALFGSFLGQQKGTKKSYYRHGPLARTILGQQQVQGIDYAYTLQGWLKGINSTAVGDGTYDMGEDGNTSSTNRFIARDAYGFSLNYFNGDYASINVNPFAEVSNSLPNVTDSKAAGKDLFNGNIRAMLVNIPQLGDAHVYGYRYDQLNRIVGMNSYTGISGNTFTASGTAHYQERVSYDANGNILRYLRNGTTASSNPLDMDSLSYKYYAGNNRLKYVDDAVSAGNYSMDIDDQSDNNYGYDEIGNLTSDVSEGITSIDWNVYGKIKSITKTGGNISYTYDASGNRISKTHNGKATWYVRDASGNVMSIYIKDATINSNHLTQDEVHLYGSSRLGILNVDEDMEIAPVPGSGQIDRGNKFFELSNHLGNVLATVSDKKNAVAQSSPNEELVDYYEADVVSANDYYPGGMDMSGRQYNATTGYRYGFNGKEKDKDVVQYDYGFRIYDPRLGRFLSVDPLAKVYPDLTTYQFASNSPIQGVDLDGREIENFLFGMKKKIFGVSSLKVNNLNTVIGEVQQQFYTVNIGNPTKTVDDLKNQISKDINSIYGTGKGTFEYEKQKTKGQITKGDFINIDPGWKGIDMTVKVADVKSYNSDKPGVDPPHSGFSVTFRTMEGHVEVGSITFTALEFTDPQTGGKSFEFSVSSISQIDNGIATTILNGFARRAQQQVWQQVLKNVATFMGGEIENAYQRIDKFDINDITPVKNSDTTIGYPNVDASPTSTETQDLEIKN